MPSTRFAPISEPAKPSGKRERRLLAIDAAGAPERDARGARAPHAASPCSYRSRSCGGSPAVEQRRQRDQPAATRDRIDGAREERGKRERDDRPDRQHATTLTGSRPPRACSLSCSYGSNRRRRRRDRPVDRARARGAWPLGAHRRGAEPATATTSAIAGAVWFPYRAGPAHKVAAWAARTREWLEQLARTRARGRRRRADRLRDHAPTMRSRGGKTRARSPRRRAGHRCARMRGRSSHRAASPRSSCHGSSVCSAHGSSVRVVTDLEAEPGDRGDQLHRPRRARAVRRHLDAARSRHRS